MGVLHKQYHCLVIVVMISVSRQLYALLWLILCSTRLAVELHPNSVPVKIVNRSGAPIDLFWVNTLDGSGEMVRQISKPIRNSSDTVIHSFDTHQFVIKYYNTKRDGDAQQMFVKGPSEETITVYSTPDPGPNGGLVLVQSTRFDDIKSSVEGATRACMHIEDTAGSVIPTPIHSFIDPPVYPFIYLAPIPHVH